MSGPSNSFEYKKNPVFSLVVPACMVLSCPSEDSGVVNRVRRVTVSLDSLLWDWNVVEVFWFCLDLAFPLALSIEEELMRGSKTLFLLIVLSSLAKQALKVGCHSKRRLSKTIAKGPKNDLGMICPLQLYKSSSVRTSVGTIPIFHVQHRLKPRIVVSKMTLRMELN